MQLPDNVFLDIVRAATGGAAAPAGPAGALGSFAGEGEDRRRAWRQRVDSTIRLSRHRAGGGVAEVVGLRDVSTRGAGLLVRELTLAPGEQLIVFADRWAEAGAGRGKAGTLNLLCTVRTVRVLRDATIHVGVEFAAPEEMGSVRHATSVQSSVGGAVRLVDAVAPACTRFAPSGATSRRELCGRNAQRGSDRLVLRSRAFMYVCGADGGQSPVEYVEVTDLSEGGVRIERGAPLATGDQFVIRVPREDEQPLTRLCVVSRVTRAGDRHSIGARFVPFSRRRGRGWFARVADWIV